MKKYTKEQYEKEMRVMIKSFLRFYRSEKTNLKYNKSMKSIYMNIDTRISNTITNKQVSTEYSIKSLYDTINKMTNKAKKDYEHRNDKELYKKWYHLNTLYKRIEKIYKISKEIQKSLYKDVPKLNENWVDEYNIQKVNTNCKYFSNMNCSYGMDMIFCGEHCAYATTNPFRSKILNFSKIY